MFHFENLQRTVVQTIYKNKETLQLFNNQEVVKGFNLYWEHFCIFVKGFKYL